MYHATNKKTKLRNNTTQLTKPN